MMSIQKLIREFCPDGVPFKALAEIGDWYGGGTPSKSKAEFWTGGTIPWVSPKDMGRPVVDSTQDHITEGAVRASATKLIPPMSVAMVVRSSILDRLFPVALIPIAVALNQDMKAVVPHDGILPGYIAHMLRSRGDAILRVARRSGGSVASIDSNKFFAFRIPVPPINVQRQIVDALDTFSGLEAELRAELTAELEARRRQFAHYMDRLLTFPAEVKSQKLSEFSLLVRGNGMPKTDFTESGVGAIHYGQIYTHYGTWATETNSFVSPQTASKLAKVDPGDVVITNTSENIEDVAKAVAWLGNEQVVTGGHATVIKHGQNAKFLSYYFRSSAFSLIKRKHVTGTKVMDISAKSLSKIDIPLPSLHEQERIATILDDLEFSKRELSIALPVEVRARRMQYEHFRDQLLSFKESA